MKRVCAVAQLYILWSGLVGTALPYINFGNEAGFVVEQNASLDLRGATLEDAYICSHGGTILANNTECTNVCLEDALATGSSAYTVSGVVTLGETIVYLGNNGIIQSNGGLVPALSIGGSEATPSIIAGYGSVGYDIELLGSKALCMRWTSPLNVNIYSADNDTTVRLEQNLVFASGYGFTGAPVEIEFNNCSLGLGGTSEMPTVIASNQTWSNANVNLIGMLALGVDGGSDPDIDAVITFDADNGIVKGNGNTIHFVTANSALDNNNYTVFLTDLTLSDMHASTLLGSGSWVCSNVTVAGSSGSITFSGTISKGDAEALDLASVGSNGYAAFSSHSSVYLNTDVAMQGTWHFGQHCFLNGNNYTLNMSNGSLGLGDGFHCNDLRLNNLSTQSIQYDEGSDPALYFSNVQIADDTRGSVLINPIIADAIGASVWLYASSFFNGGNVWFDGASVQLLSNVSLNTPWISADEGLVIDGGGNVLYVDSGGSLAVADAPLTLRNIVIDNVTYTTFDSLSSGNIILSHVTLKLAESVNFSDKAFNFIINGPVTIVVGNYSFVVDNESVIDGATVYYDTLNEVDGHNIIGFSFDNNGRLSFVPATNTQSLSFTATEDNTTVYLQDSRSIVIGNAIVPDNTVSFSGAYSMIFDGLGRSLAFPAVNDTVMSVALGTTVATTNIVLNGLVPGHLAVEGDLYFGHNTVIRLTQNWVGDYALDKALIFGTSSTANDQYMVLDLAGFTIDMATAEAALVLCGGSGQILRICNGRLLNLSASKLAGLDDNSSIILENVELALTVVDEGSNPVDYVFGGSNTSLKFQGNCSIHGASGVVFENVSNADITIASGSTVTIGDGVTYSHHNQSDTNFIMEDRSSQLVLIGATFKSDNTYEGDRSLFISDGKIVVDHKTTFDVGSKGIVLATNLDFQIRPSATVTVVGSGTLSYQNIP